MSVSDDPSIVAAELALGVLADDERMTANQRMHSDPSFAADVAAWESLLAPIGLQLRPVAPSEELIDKIEATIARREKPLAFAETIRSHQGEWILLSPGVQTKLLWRNEAAARQSILLKIDPGATYTAHGHDDDEECFVLSGEIQFGDVMLYQGDYHVAHKGSHHGLVSSRNGCLCLITTGL